MPSEPIGAKESNLSKGVVAAFVVFSIITVFILFQNGTIDPVAMYNRMFVLKRIQVNGLVLSVRLAKTEAEHLASLNDLEALPQNQGMLFVFDQDGLYDISTANIRFPVDIIWLSKDGSIIDEQTHIGAGLRDPVHAHVPARYVLVVNAGTVERNNIEMQMYVDLHDVDY